MQRSAVDRLFGLAAPAEVPELRLIFGESLVRRCEDLCLEVESLRAILSDFLGDRLTEGPARGLLERKIQVLQAQVGHLTSEKDTRIRDYLETKKTKKELDFDRFRDSMNIDDAHVIVPEVRRFLRQEATHLENELDQLNASFDDRKNTSPPSLLELRQYASVLEDRWLRKEQDLEQRPSNNITDVAHLEKRKALLATTTQEEEDPSWRWPSAKAKSRFRSRLGDASFRLESQHHQQQHLY